MEDKKRELEGSSSRGNEWEVVSLTSSAYAAVPGPGTVELAEENKDKELPGRDPEPPIALFMSDHFVFPPCEHENLPLDLDSHEVTESMHSNMLDAGYDDRQPFTTENLSEADELPGIGYFDKGKQVWLPELEFDEGKALDAHKMVDADGSYYNTTPMTGAVSESDDVTEPGLLSPKNMDSSSEVSPPVKLGKTGRYSISGYESWLRRHVASLYAHAKEANKFWSVVVAAALMGLVILGQRWQQERWQLLQLKWNSSNHDRVVHRVLGPVSRFKDVLIGTQRRGLGGISAIDG